MPRNRTFLVIAALVLAVIGGLGLRALEHEALSRRYQAQTLAQTRSEQAASLVMGFLQQRAARLDAVTELVRLDRAVVGTLRETDGEIDEIFVLQKNRLLYPDPQKPMTQREKEWTRMIAPLVDDPSLLYFHGEGDEKSEMETPRAGWFVINEAQEPALIYWRATGDGRFTGFRIAYVKLLSDVVNATDFDFSPDLLLIKENGRLLYQSRNRAETDGPTPRLAPLVSPLPYPLNAWAIEYHGRQESARAVYLWGGALLATLLAAVALILFRLYREYTQTARLARQQVDFVSQVSHELKTPLTNITLYAELLKEELSELDEDGMRYIDVIVNESGRLSRLIQNILSFAHAPKIHLQPVDVNAAMARVVQSFTPSFQARGLTLTLRMPEGVVVESDVDRLTQIVSNFLSNAEKYAAAGKRVDLVVEVLGDGVEIRVRDYGPGLSEKEAKLVFQPFYRVHSALTEGVSGAGIGLTIARQMAETLGGEILIDRFTPGVQFTLRLGAAPGTGRRT
jgi:signal transduction histidine kinase